jgi:dipeptidyl-peptidase 4
MTQLTVERLFSDPPLAPGLPADVRFSPDGSYLVYLRTAPDDRNRLDLWRHDLSSNTVRCWIDARRLQDPSPAAAAPTAAEKAERERKRQFSSGITSYEISADGRHLLLPVDGAGFLLDISSDELRRFTPAGTRQTDFQFSPGSRFISYVRDNNLYCYELADGTEHALTDDGSELIANGIADFIAAEEMHRYSGHWWSDDETAIAFTRVDESPVAISRRYEIDADEFNVIEQRYPYAGADNADVTLKVVDRQQGSISSIDWQQAPDDYLARVCWTGSELAVQVQSRDQQTLSLLRIDPVSGSRRQLLQEHSETWINLHDNFKPSGDERFLWTSERDGYSHLYLYDDGKPHQLTAGDAAVNKVLHVGEDSVLIAGWFELPTEQHLYRVSLHGEPLQRISTDAGWHEFSVDTQGRYAVDRYSSLDDPGGLRLLDLQTDTITGLEEAGQDQQHPYQPYLDAHCAGQLGQLQAADGQTLHYRLTRPQHLTAAVPLIVLVYGGPGVQRVKNEWPPLTTQLFTQRGFAVLELDNRGSSNRGRAFEAPIYRQLGETEVADQVTGARFAASLDWVDADRIGVFGHSYGGFMTLMCLTKAPGVFKAGVSVAPVTDWGLYDTHYTERYLSTPGANPEGYQASSVFPYLENLRGRLLIIHGMADDNVLFTNSTRIFKALQQQIIPFEMMTYPGSKHALQEREVAIHRYNLILDFFERNL